MQYSFEWRYIRGEENSMADVLSRLNENVLGSTTTATVAALCLWDDKDMKEDPILVVAIHEI